ncbi:MAG: CoA-binding protein [bacterium]
MSSLQEAVHDFLSQKRIAVVGVSSKRETPANGIYRKLKKSGYQVFPVTPNAETFDGDACFADLLSIPQQVDSVVVITRPEVTEQVVHQCVDAGISRVWMHRSLGFFPTSVSEQAVQFCRENDIAVIPGGCPMMFCEPVDFGHKCMRWMLNLTGGLPKHI